MNLYIDTIHYNSFSSFCREETVITLLRLGAAPGAVEDPTSTSPGGKTAADLASSRGHKGIAGYLAEADLTTHLSSLTFNENVMDSVAATIAAEKAIETAAQIVPSDMLANENLSLKGSLDAVRKSAHAADLLILNLLLELIVISRKRKNLPNFLKKNI